MIYIFPDINGDCSVHYQPDLLSAAEKAKGIAVESLPAPETPAGKQAILRADKETKKTWYDYIDEPQSPLEQRINLLENALNELILGGI